MKEKKTTATPNKPSWTILLSAFGTSKRRFFIQSQLPWRLFSCTFSLNIYNSMTICRDYSTINVQTVKLLPLPPPHPWHTDLKFSCIFLHKCNTFLHNMLQNSHIALVFKYEIVTYKILKLHVPKIKFIQMDGILIFFGLCTWIRLNWTEWAYKQLPSIEQIIAHYSYVLSEHGQFLLVLQNITSNAYYLFNSVRCLAWKKYTLSPRSWYTSIGQY